MSHFVSVKSKVKNPTYLKNALTRLNIPFTEGNFVVESEGKRSKAEISVGKTAGMHREKDGTWSFVGDPYYCESEHVRKYYRKQDKFLVDLSTAYAIEETKGELTLQNFFCTSNEDAKIGADGKIHQVYTRF